MIVSLIQWSIDELLVQTNRSEPALPGGPEGLLYVPPTYRLPLMDSLHTSLGSGHPGSLRTLSLLRRRYWCPTVAQDISRYLKGCSVCAITNAP